MHGPPQRSEPPIPDPIPPTPNAQLQQFLSSQQAGPLWGRRRALDVTMLNVMPVTGRLRWGDPWCRELSVCGPSAKQHLDEDDQYIERYQDACDRGRVGLEWGRT